MVLEQTAPVLVIRHAPGEDEGCLGPLLAEHALPVVRVGPDDELPTRMAPSELSAVVVLGGPQSVGEQSISPRLRQELALVERVLSANLPVLGICLGSQILARALGARVYRLDAAEIGWHLVTADEAARGDPLGAVLSPSFRAFHWHSEAFELPAGAEHLASSRLTPHQAFRLGNAYGLQFHPEATRSVIEAMIRNESATPTAELLDSNPLLISEQTGVSLFRAWLRSNKLIGPSD